MDDASTVSPTWSTLDSDDLSEVTLNSRHTGVVMHDWDTFHDQTVAQGPMPSALVVMLPDDPVQQDSWRRGVARLGAVRNDHVVAVVRTRVVGRELQVDHDLPAGSRSAREWITPESLLSPGQIVTLGAGLARGLAALHAEGICRAGCLTLDDVIIDREGRPRWRLAYAVPQGQTELADDVASLAAILRELLAERTAPGPLTLALLRAEDEDPRRRPAASSLADSLMASSAAEPLALPRRESTAPPRPTGVRSASAPAPTRVSERRDAPHTSRRRRPPWRIVAIVVITAVAGLGVLRGAAVAANSASTPLSSSVPSSSVGPSSSADPSSSAVPTSSADPLSSSVVEVPTDTDKSGDQRVDESGDAGTTVDEVWGPAPTPSPAGGGRSPDLPWAAVLAALDVARSQAFSRGDASALARANAAGSPAMEADLATLSGLRAAGLVTRGFALEVVSVTEISSDASSVLLRVVDRRAAYTLVTASGAVQERRPARPESTWLVTLSRSGSPASWRINEVKPG